MTRIRALLASVLLVLASLAGTGCKTNPTTGRSQFLPISVQEEAALGEQAGPEFLRDYGGELPDAQAVAYVRGIGNQLAQVAEQVDAEGRQSMGIKDPPPDRAWEFHVIDSAVINAFALPGGKVFISRELLGRMEDESQLAGVLGHEVGHVMGRHIADQMGKGVLVQGAIAAGSVAAGIGTSGSSASAQLLTNLGLKAAGAGGSIYLLSFGRDQELEADSLGVRYMTRLGYNPVGQLRVMEILREAGGGRSTPEWLSTHPAPDSRIDAINEMIREKYPDYNDPNKYKVNREAFKANALDRLANLPPAKHGQQKASDAGEADGGASSLATSAPVGPRDVSVTAAPATPAKRPPLRWVRPSGGGPYIGIAGGGAHINCPCHSQPALSIPDEAKVTGTRP